MKRFVVLVLVLATLVGCARERVFVVPKGELPNDIFPEGGKEPTEKDRRITLYMFDGNRLTPVTRVGSSKLPEADLALRSLMCGVTSEEKRAGLTTALGSPVELLGVTVKDRVARVDFNAAFSSREPEVLLKQAAQVVYTMTELDSLDAVGFYSERKNLAVPDQDLKAHAEPVVRSRYTDFGPRSTLAGSDFEGPLPLGARLSCRDE